MYGNASTAGIEMDNSLYIKANRLLHKSEQICHKNELLFGQLIVSHFGIKVIYFSDIKVILVLDLSRAKGKRGNESEKGNRKWKEGHGEIKKKIKIGNRK